MRDNEFQESKKKAFKDQAAKQRDKIRGLKNVEVEKQNQALEQLQDQMPENEPALSKKSAPLTAENLEKHQAEKSSKALSVASSKKPAKKGREKPAWAQTEKQLEEAKEAEIDELLEFAYELDYEKYMDDYEVRQALAIIKDRVNEVTKQQDWKEKITEEWN